MRKRLGRGDPALRGAIEQAGGEEERLVDVLDGVGLLGHGHRERVEPDGSAGERDAECGEDGSVDLVEAELVDLEERQRVAGDAGGDPAVGADLGEVADALQEAVGDARRTAGAAGDLLRRVGLERHAQDPSGALHDRDQVGGVVVVEAGDEAEAVAQWTGDEAGAGGGSNQREARQLEPDRARRGALADDDVELEVLHRGIEHLFDGSGQAMDLVDEEDVAVVEVGEDGGEVTGALERRPTRDAQARPRARRRRCPDSVVFPRPGAPANRMWSTDCPRRRAAPSMISRCSFSRGWPTNSSRRRGRRLVSSAISTGSAAGFSTSSLLTRRLR